MYCTISPDGVIPFFIPFGSGFFSFLNSQNLVSALDKELHVSSGTVNRPELSPLISLTHFPAGIRRLRFGRFVVFCFGLEVGISY